MGQSDDGREVGCEPLDWLWALSRFDKLKVPSLSRDWSNGLARALSEADEALFL